MFLFRSHLADSIPHMPEPHIKRLLLIGWDAADWKIIDPLLKAGKMPFLSRLIDGGVRANLATLDPKLSPMLWTSIATGKTADKHGILNFIEPEPTGESLRIVSSTSRKVKAIWNILTQNDRRTILLNWYASHPAEPIRGVSVSNLFLEGMPDAADGRWPLAPGAVYPPELSDEIAGLRLHPSELHPEELLAFIPGLTALSPSDPRIATLRRHIAQCASVHNAATALLAREKEWDCAMVFYDTIDCLGHHFMQYYPPAMSHISPRDAELFGHVMHGVYQLQDMMLGALLELAGPETTVIVLSDHGFHSDHLRPPVRESQEGEHPVLHANWHRPLGMLAMGGPGVKKGERVYGANVLDVTPTALTLLGIPVGADMDGRVLAEAFERPPVIDRVFTWDALAGEAGLHPPDLRLDPFEASDAIAQLADLGYVQDLPEDAKGKLDILQRETRFNLAVVYMTTRRPGEATPLLEELHRARPNDDRYAMSLARCYYAQGRYKQCRAIIASYLESHPATPDAGILLGAALFAEGRLEEAGAVLEKAERESPGGPELACMLGDLYLVLKRWEDAERAFARAAAMDPNEPRAHHGLARVALNREQFEAAADHCLTAVGLQHFMPDAHYTLGVALTWMKDFEHAIQSFRVALSMQPGLIEAHRFLASIHRHLRQNADAARHRDLALDLISRRKRGEATPEDDLREPPMGPHEWAQRLGVPDV